MVGTDVSAPDVHLRRPGEPYHRAAQGAEGVDLGIDQIAELRTWLDREINQHPDNLSRAGGRLPKGFLLGEAFGLIEAVASELGYYIPEPFYSPISSLSGPNSQRLMMAVPPTEQELPTPISNVMIYVSWRKANDNPRSSRVVVNVDLDVLEAEGE